MTYHHTPSNSPSSFSLTPRRIEGLQDGVFAIVMTLLVLEIKIPEISNTAEMSHELMALLPIFLTYFITFINLGIYWVGQQIQFHSIERSDRIFSWIHITFLMFISLLPFSSAFLGRYPDEQIASLVYGINLCAVGLMSYAGWRYASSHHRLTTHRISDAMIHSVNRRILVAPIAAIVAMILSFISVPLSELCYVLILPYYIFPGKIDRFWSQKAIPHVDTDEDSEIF